MKQPSSPARKGTKKAPAKKKPAKAVRKTKTVPLKAGKSTTTVKKRRDLHSSQRKLIPPVNGKHTGGRPNDVWPESRVESEILAMLEILENEIKPGGKRQVLAKEELAHKRGYSWASFNEARKHFPLNSTIGEAYARIGEILKMLWLRLGATGSTHFVFAKFVLSANHGMRETQAVEQTITEKRTLAFGDDEITY